MDESDLIRKAQEAFAERFEIERPKLLRIAGEIMGDPDDAEDIVSDAYLKARAAIHDFNPRQPSSFFAWLKRIVTNLALDSLKRGKVPGDDGMDESGQTVWTARPSDIQVEESEDDPVDRLEEKQEQLEQIRRKMELARKRGTFLGRAMAEIDYTFDERLRSHALRIVDDPRAAELLDSLSNAGGRITVDTFLAIVRICANCAEPFESVSPRKARSIVKKDAGREPLLRSVAARKVRGGTAYHKYQLVFHLEKIFRALCGGKDTIRKALSLASGMTYGKEWTPASLKTYRKRARKA